MFGAEQLAIVAPEVQAHVDAAQQTPEVPVHGLVLQVMPHRKVTDDERQAVKGTPEVQA